ncbi:MAG: GGDEF domain-containing protein [Treponema sp.]|nr:GGDEF domain-containing protein [Treponema sp.]
MAINTKIIKLNDKLDIVDGNREYYIYFERIGHRFSRLEEIIHPDQKSDFLEFVRNSADEKEFEVFKFKKHTDEFKLNIVQVFEEEKGAERIKCLRLIEIEDIFSYLSFMDSETVKLLGALSLTGETFFSYERETNVIRVLKYSNGKRVSIFDQDIELWRDLMIQNSMLPENQFEEFRTLVDNMKSCPSKIYSTLKCAFRTSGKIIESLDFIGTRVEVDGKISMTGIIASSTRAKQSLAAKNLLGELQIDSLTKTYNKKTISEIAAKRLNEARGKERVAFVIVDLDHFKPVNDAYGHLAGDKVLEQSGGILNNIVGNNGFVGRYGGDEFFIVLNNVESEVLLRGTLQAILETVRNSFADSFGDIKITTSIGASVFPDNGTTYDELFKKADFCLYRAKDKGRNRYVFFRDDLHLKLYQQSVEDTAGVKYQGREILELKYMAAFMQNLGWTPYKAIKDVLEHMRETYNLSDVSIYYGENLNRIYCVGEESPLQDNARYVLGSEFKKLLDTNKRFVRMDFPEDLKDSPEIRDEFLRRNVRSTIQYILGSPEEIKGLVTFDRLGSSSQWAEYEVNCAVMFASSYNLLPEAIKVDFALYSKLKNLGE